MTERHNIIRVCVYVCVRVRTGTELALLQGNSFLFCFCNAFMNILSPSWLCVGFYILHAETSNIIVC